MDAETAKASVREPTLAEIAEQFSKAVTDLGAARVAAGDAKKRETDALNLVNRLQAQFDAAVEKQRKAAPAGTDWYAREKHGK